MEYKTFYLCDDASENFFTGRITRAKHEVKPELWGLKPGDYLPSGQPGLGFMLADEFEQVC